MLGAAWQPDLILVAEWGFSMISLLMVMHSYEIFSLPPPHKKVPLTPADPWQAPLGLSWSAERGFPSPQSCLKPIKNPV